MCLVGIFVCRWSANNNAEKEKRCYSESVKKTDAAKCSKINCFNSELADGNDGESGVEEAGYLYINLVTSFIWNWFVLF